MKKSLANLICKESEAKSLRNITATFNTLADYREYSQAFLPGVKSKFAVLVKVQTKEFIELVQELKKAEPSYYDTYFQIASNQLEQLMIRVPDVKLVADLDYKQVLADLITYFNLHLQSGTLNLLYSRLPRNVDDYTKVCIELQQEFGTNEIPKEYLVNILSQRLQATYARQVLYAFILRSRDRWSKFFRCLEGVSPEVCLYAMQKGIDKILADKLKYYTTGTATSFVKGLPLVEIVRLRELLYQNRSMKDPTVMLVMYDERIYKYDFT